jgi:hypothetical protein
MATDGMQGIVSDHGEVYLIESSRGDPREVAYFVHTAGEMRTAGDFAWDDAARLSDPCIKPECEDGDDSTDNQYLHFLCLSSNNSDVSNTLGSSGSTKQAEHQQVKAPIITLNRNLAYDIDRISDHRLRARLLRNRASAERSRLRRMTAEDKLQERVVDLGQTRAALQLENDSLRQQLIAAQVSHLFIRCSTFSALC